MNALIGQPLTFLASADFTSNAMRSFISPVIATLSVLAGLVCTFFLVVGGTHYMSSSGDPEKLARAKKIIKNALIGLVLVIAAATLTSILSHAYSGTSNVATEQFPTLQPLEPTKNGVSLFDVVINAIVAVLRNIVSSIGEPFIRALSYFTNSTPLMAHNESVFKLWLAIVGMADVLFILVVILLGFQIMSATTLGFEEIDIKQLLPQLAIVFLLMNVSIFAIDGLIGLSNGMIHALQSGFQSVSTWDVLANITKKSSDMGLAGLLVMIAFLVLSVILLVYYVLRLVGLYLGAILSPLVILLWLLPAFKDFAMTALKTYLVAIYVLFVHVVIVLLAASIFVGIQNGDKIEQPNALMALIVGLATLIALLKAQGMMNQLVSAASGPKAVRELSGTFMRGVSYMTSTARMTHTITKSTNKSIKKINRMRNNNGESNAKSKSGDKSGDNNSAEANAKKGADT